MPIWLTKLTTGYPGPPYAPEPGPHSWRPMTVVEQDKAGGAPTNWTVVDMRNLGSKADVKAARRCLTAFQERVLTGQPLNDLYDSNQYHEALTCRTGVKVWRVRGAGKTRIFFVNGHDRKLIIVHILAKRTDRLSQGDEGRICDRVARLISAGVLR